MQWLVTFSSSEEFLPNSIDYGYMYREEGIKKCKKIAIPCKCVKNQLN